jgi:N-acetylglutamate synthase-like GNAT family acetyltransferase
MAGNLSEERWMMTVEFRLRKGTQNDEALIRDLVRRVKINPMGLHWERFLVAEDAAGKFIGCAQIKHHGDGSNELASLAVEQEYRGNGVAAALIRALLADGPRPLYLMCRPELGSLYQKFGFQPVPPEAMPKYFKRINAAIQVLSALSGDRKKPLIMQVEK